MEYCLIEHMHSGLNPHQLRQDFFVIFRGAIILEETKLAYLLHEKSVSSLLDRTTNCEW
jgi:hypothetical protein